MNISTDGLTQFPCRLQELNQGTKLASTTEEDF